MGRESHVGRAPTLAVLMAWPIAEPVMTTIKHAIFWCDRGSSNCRRARHTRWEMVKNPRILTRQVNFGVNNLDPFRRLPFCRSANTSTETMDHIALSLASSASGDRGYLCLDMTAPIKLFNGRTPACNG